MKNLKQQMDQGDPERAKKIGEALKKARELHEFLEANGLGDFMIEIAGRKGEIWWFSEGAVKFFEEADASMRRTRTSSALKRLISLSR